MHSVLKTLSKSSNRSLKQRWLLVLPLVTGLGLARIIWHAIRLPFSNPWHVSGPLTSIGYNPANDLLRFGLWIGLPLVFLLLFWSMTRNRLKIWHTIHDDPAVIKARSSRAAAILLFALAFLAALNIPTSLSSAPLVDTFHEGETLGPAVSLLHGKAPYKDIIFLHGPYQDPLRSILAFRIWGRSIGAVRTLESIHKIIAMLMLALLCLILLPGSASAPLAMFIGLLALQRGHRLGSIQLVLLKNRDMTTFAFLALCASIQYRHKATSNHFGLAAVSFCFVAIAVGSFAYSVDRGFFLTATMVILWPLALFRQTRKSDRRIFTLASAAGFALAAILVGLAIHQQWKAFFSFVFVTMPRYKELMDGFIFPIEKGRFLIVCLFLATGVYIVAVETLRCWTSHGRQNIGQRLSAIASNHLCSLALALLAIFTFRSALGRSDWPHVISSAYPTFLLAGHLILKGPGKNLAAIRSLLAAERKVVILASLLVAAVALITGFKIACGDLLKRNFPLSVTDQEFMRPQDKAAVTYLRRIMQPDDSFYTLTSEGTWYYWLDRPSPTRHAIAWFAMPVFYQREIIRDLERKKVRFILVKNGNWPCAIDGISIEKRLPLIMTYIRAHYVPHKTIGDNRLWIRRLP